MAVILEIKYIILLIFLNAGCITSKKQSQSISEINYFDSGRVYFFSAYKAHSKDSQTIMENKAIGFFYKYLDTTTHKDLNNDGRNALVWLSDIYSGRQYSFTKGLFEYAANNYSMDALLINWLSGRLGTKYRTKEFIEKYAPSLNKILGVKPFSSQYHEVSKTLEKCFDDDQRFRKKLFLNDSKIDSITKERFLDSLDFYDKKNVAIVSEILNKYGWQSVSDIGLKASRGIFFVIHHADSATFYGHYADVLNAYKTERILPDDYKLYIDRYYAGKYGYQLYGTQTYYDSNLHKNVLYPLKDTSLIPRPSP